jgi:transposase
MVLVGDRGMISTASIEQLRAERFGWITALKSGQIRTLLHDGKLQMDLFDERNLFELAHPDFPGERLVACRNPELAKRRAHKRTSLIAATVAELEKVRAMVARGKLPGAAAIGVRVGKALNKYKVAKHFDLTIGEASFDFAPIHDKVAEEAALDGLYVIRTGVAKRRMTAADAVRNYKALSSLERAFRSLKSIDLKVRPIHHRRENRVRAHIFLCMLAYYVEWHLREAWRELMFADEDQTAKETRDPMPPSKRSLHTASRTAPRPTASKPCSKPSPPSCATPVASQAPTPALPSTSSPHPTTSSGAPWTSSKPSPRRQKTAAKKLGKSSPTQENHTLRQRNFSLVIWN